MRGLALILLGSLTASPALAGEAAVSFLSGGASANAEGKKPRSLKVGAEVAVGETIRTDKGARLELTLPDGSKVRLAGGAEATFSEALFRGKQRESVSFKLLAGRLWAAVVKATGGRDAFQVETHNAVSGVRGTSFAVLAAADTSALVRVYSGTVGVRPSAARTGERKQIAGPREIDRRQWEEIIATAMKQVRISQAGDISPAEDFEDSGESQQWAQWNQSRDAEGGDKR